MSDISSSYDPFSAQEMNRLKTTSKRANLAAIAFGVVALAAGSYGFYALNSLNTDETPQVGGFSHSFSLTR